jgi:peptidoglycan/LPS O-acetylase OafA/YrhL
METSPLPLPPLPKATPRPVAAALPRSAGHGFAWFPGLNGLRFLAAATVMLMHIHNNMGISGLPQLPAWPILFKGLYAVSFFFVLSGFLITWLLLQEQQRSHSISIKKFYLRRVFRIWPLYFTVIAAGLFFYWRLAPALHLAFESDYPQGLGVLLYTLFLANLMNSLYHVGGILHVTWSIAVEEQFYLFWAPLVKKCQRRLPTLILAVTSLSLAVNMLNTLNTFHLSKGMQSFVGTLQFHYMGFGAGFAWLLHKHRNRFLALPIFRSPALQWLCLLLIGEFFFLYKRNVLGELLLPIPLACLFGWLIINISSNPGRILHLDSRPLNYLGKISYGLYMYHMPMVYATAFLFKKMARTDATRWYYFPAYFTLVFALTGVLASGSYYVLEKPLLRYSKRFQ